MTSMNKITVATLSPNRPSRSQGIYTIKHIIKSRDRFELRESNHLQHTFTTNSQLDRRRNLKGSLVKMHINSLRVYSFCMEEIKRVVGK